VFCPVAEFLRISAPICLNPRCFNNFNIQIMALAHVNPTVTKHSIPRGQHFIARAQRVGQCCFPTSCSGCWKDKDLRSFAFYNSANPCACGVQNLPK
jgi:hypothetical protein